MLPSGVMIVERIARNAAGKVDMSALAAWHEKAESEKMSQSQSAQTPSRNLGVGSPSLQLLHAIWCDLLDRKNIDIDDNFFDLGGHSLLALRLLQRLRAATQLPAKAAEMSLLDIFRYPNIRALAAFLDDSHSRAMLEKTTVSREGRRRLTRRRDLLRVARPISRSHSDTAKSSTLGESSLPPRRVLGDGGKSDS
jgi:hypothetical protein